jgi:hypothetical protein
MQHMLFFYSSLLIQIYWITCYLVSLTSGSDHSSNGQMMSCACCYYDLNSNGQSSTSIYIYTHTHNHYPSYIVHPPYIKSKYHKASYIYKFIHHIMFMITIHCSSIIHQKLVPKGIIHIVHDPHGSRMVASSNLLSR